MPQIQVISGCVRVLNHQCYHNLLYQAYSSSKTRKNSLKSRFSHFFCIIGLILHHFGLRLGNSWLSSDLKQLVLLEYAISGISNQPKSKKSIKTSFSKIVEKSSKNEKFGTWVPKGGPKCLKFRFISFIFANWTILSDFEQNQKIRKKSSKND